MTFAVFAPVRGHEGVELHGVRLQTEAKEGANGRLGGGGTRAFSPSGTLRYIPAQGF